MWGAEHDGSGGKPGRRTGTLSRRALVMWLLSPIVVVTALWFSIDRTRARPRTEAGLPARTMSAGDLAQGVRILVRDRTGRAAAAGRMFLASSHNAWRGDDPAFEFTRRDDSLWQLDLAKLAKDGPFRFTITLGSWSAVERDAGTGRERRRELPVVEVGALAGDEKPVVTIEVEDWFDASAPPPSPPPGNGPGAPVHPDGTPGR